MASTVISAASLAASSSVSGKNRTPANVVPLRRVAARHSPMMGSRLSARLTASAAPARGELVVRAAANAKGKKVCVITGASSGLGLHAAAAIAKKPDWHVVMAVRDFAKAERAAKKMGMTEGTHTIMHLDLASRASVRQFVEGFSRSGMGLDTLVANAAVYLPTAKEPTFNADGYEISVATNHLGHFLLCNLMLEKLAQSKNNPRMIIVGSVTGNTNTLAGNIPPKADLGQLQGMEAGFKEPIAMIDGGEFDGAKAYKDSKVCNMLTMREFHRRFHSKTGITFSSLYPGCIADTGLFRNHVQLFRDLFPKFQKYVTKGYVSQEEAGRRLCAVATDAGYDTSGAYWSWAGEGASGKFVNTPSAEVQDEIKGKKLWELSEKLVDFKAAAEPRAALAA